MKLIERRSPKAPTHGEMLAEIAYSRLLAFGFTDEQAAALASAGYSLFFVPAKALGL